MWRRKPFDRNFDKLIAMAPVTLKRELQKITAFSSQKIFGFDEHNERTEDFN
jgi:hypothetical protein